MTERSDTGSVGARLKLARESKGVTLRQIANTTRIAVSALDAIERDDVKKLPGGIFARSFVRAYAGELLEQARAALATTGLPDTRALLALAEMVVHRDN